MLRNTCFLLLAFLGLARTASAQNFDGVIEFKKQVVNGSSMNYVYYIKGDKVRIDEIGEASKKVEGSYLLDLKNNKTVVLNHARKLYTNRVPETTLVSAPAGAVSINTKKSQTLHGYTCNQYVVKNTADSTQISYWVAAGKFTFFQPMLKLLNRQEAFSTYFMALNVKNGSFPFLAIQQDLSGKEIARLEVTRIEKKTVTDALFEIPKDYTEFK